MTGYQSKKAAAQDKLAVDREQLEHWLEALKDIDALHHPAEPESADAQKAIADMGKVLAQQDGQSNFCAQCEAFARELKAVKQALAAQPSQEPVAWMTPDGEGFRIRFSPPTNDVPLGWDALYTTPQQRTWVGLTDEEISDMAINNPPMVHEFARAIEAKLKEKNT
jgi:hypothetical protein